MLHCTNRTHVCVYVHYLMLHVLMINYLVLICLFYILLPMVRVYCTSLLKVYPTRSLTCFLYFFFYFYNIFFFFLYFVYVYHIVYMMYVCMYLVVLLLLTFNKEGARCTCNQYFHYSSYYSLAFHHHQACDVLDHNIPNVYFCR